MFDPKTLSTDELILEGRSALKLQRYQPAHDFLFEYCERLTAERVPVEPGIIASYALTLGHLHRLKEGLEICRKALGSDRRNPHIALCLAKLYLLADSRKNAIEAVERGLAANREHPGLVRMRKELGVRRRPPIRFLPRDNAFNVKLGRVLARIHSRNGAGPVAARQPSAVTR